jgi:cytoskeletal protein CcmA (bactofilin family)
MWSGPGVSVVRGAYNKDSNRGICGMKRAKLWGILGLFVAPLVLGVGLARAQAVRTGDNTTVAAREVIDSSLYAAGRTIDIAGEVNGDVFCVGQNVTVSGTVRGDVVCAGQTVHISGTVEGDVRAAGQNVVIGANVKGGLTVGAQSFTLENGATIARDATIGGDTAVLNGSVGRDVVIGSAQTTLSQNVGRNVKATVEHLNITGRATIGGELSYTSRNKADIATGAEVAGRTTRYKPQAEKQSDYGKVFNFGFGMGLYAVLSLLIVALALVLLFPHAFDAASVVALRDPFKTFLWGLGASFVAPVLIIGLLVTVIGIPLGLLVLLAWLLVVMLSGPFFGYAIGRLIWREQKHAVLTMLVGSLIVLFAYLVPVIGAFMLLAALWFGSGMVLRTVFHRTPKPHYTPRPSATKAA